jgi:hypothetical protein
MHSTNGNGSAIARRVISGRGLAHRRLDKRQRAVLAADVVDGVVTVQLTARQVAQLLGVNVSYIALAQTFSPQKRAAILAGWDSTSFTVLLNLPARQLALPMPAPAPINSIDDATLMAAVRAAGVERVLAAAVAVEHS